MKTVGIIVLGFMGLMFAATPMYADLLTNGGFETGNFTGWNVSGIYACVSGSLCDGNFADADPGPHSGGFAAYLGSPGNLNGQGEADDILSQTVAAAAGQSYIVDFFLAVGSTAQFGGSVPNSFSVSWDGNVLGALNNVNGQPYTEYSFAVTGTGSDTLLFDTETYPSVFVLDDVSVTAANVSAPEPASFGLLFTMLLAAAFVAQKKLAWSC
jgi:hypothetical protein